MAEAGRIMTVEKDDGDGLIVTFSDGTTAGYVAEELLKLRPHREPVGIPIERSSALEGPEIAQPPKRK